MLAKPYRLRSSADIARVYKRGQYGASQGVISVKAAASGRNYCRAVIVVSKKVDKRAVVRNRIRRRLASELERRWATLTPGYDIVVSVHSDISMLPAPELKEHLTRALTKVGLNT